MDDEQSVESRSTSVLKPYIRRTLARFGFDISRGDSLLLESEFQEIFSRCHSFSMASRERLYAVFQAVQYVNVNRIPGDLVECGVWRGGASMVAALTQLSQGKTSRQIWLYDTFAGMTTPTEKDVHRWAGKSAWRKWASSERAEYNDWCRAGLDEVKRNLFSTDYPRDLIEFIQGDVRETLTTARPDQIAVLRLDTDWYDSNKIELEALYPRLSKGGVLILDDYGVWNGARQAVDEYFEKQDIKMLLQRTDYTGRMGLKL
jgi:O-methyltransferase